MRSQKRLVQFPVANALSVDVKMGGGLQFVFSVPIIPVQNLELEINGVGLLVLVLCWCRFIHVVEGESKRLSLSLGSCGLSRALSSN